MQRDFKEIGYTYSTKSIHEIVLFVISNYDKFRTHWVINSFNIIKKNNLHMSFKSLLVAQKGVECQFLSNS